MKLVLPARIVTTEAYKAQLQSVADEFYDDFPSAEEFGQRIHNAEIIVTNVYQPITRKVIDAALRLKYIIVPAVGYQSVDVAYAKSRDITVINCPSHNSQAVAEHAISLLLAANRQIVAAQTELRAGKWNDETFSGLELSGKSLGLIGYGNIGQRIEKLATGLGLQTSYTNSRSTEADLENLLATADFVCVSVPLSPQTTNLLDKKQLSHLKPTAILINVGRAAVINQAALLALLKANKIRAAATDVFEHEPAPGESLDVAIIELATLPNVIATPHIAYNTPESREKLGKELLENIQACLEGAAINVVN